MAGDPQLDLPFILFGLQIIIMFIIHILRGNFPGSRLGGIIIKDALVNIMIIKLHPHGVGQLLLQNGVIADLDWLKTGNVVQFIIVL